MPFSLRKIPLLRPDPARPRARRRAGLPARSNDLSWLTSTLHTVGSLFVQLLKLAVPPLVFTAIVVSVVSLRERRQRRPAGR